MLICHLPGALLVAAALVSTTAAAQSARDSFSVDEAKSAILDDLPDPKGAKFRQLFLSEHGDSKVTLCGEINAKDRAGKYTGFGVISVSVQFRNPSPNKPLATTT